MAKLAPATRGVLPVGRPPRDEGEFLDAALDVFARRGLGGASMDDLASAARTTKPTLYARFGSKNELYERVVRREADAFITSILASYEAAESLSIYEMTEKPMAAWFEYLDDHPAALELLFSPDRSPAAQRIAQEIEERIIDGLSAMMGTAMRRKGRSAPAQARFLAAMVFGATLHASRLNARTRLLAADHAAALATSFIDAGQRGLDLELMRPLPRRRRSA
jgi:AcrR family transcriptional regulator